MPTAEATKLDLRKTLKTLYSASSDPVIVEPPKMNYLMIDGTGDPNTSPDYAAAIEALYGVSYTIKFTVKHSRTPLDYAVMPLEGLWWADDMQAFAKALHAKWHWTAMILQPGFVTSSQVEAALASVRLKHPSPALDLLRFEPFAEGRAAQLLHIGSYSAEEHNIARLHAFIGAQGGQLSGKHHEIYLSDARRTAPERLKTIIRQPFVMREQAA